MPIDHARTMDAIVRNADCHGRPGFSLPELVVALTLVTIGLLALAVTSAFLTYEHAASGRAERAATIAGSRLELLRAAGCAPSAGSEVIDGLTAVWSVTVAGRVAHATASVSWVERNTPVAHRYESGFPC